MKLSTHLKEIALLGTAKKELDFSLIPQEVASELKKQELDTEEKFLNTLCLDFYYHLAGNIPEDFTDNWDSEPITENKEEIDPELSKHLGKILKIEPEFFDSLFENWIQIVCQKNQIIPSKHIIDLLKIGASSSREIQEKIKSVIGNKGNWIITQQSNWKLDTKKLENRTIWEEGTTTERKQFFENCRKKNINEALDLLISTWKEESIKDKLYFLKVIQQNSNSSDISFLEEKLQEEFVYSEKEKPTQKECRKVISEILLQHESSLLHKTTIEKLTNYITENQSIGILSLLKKKKSILKLPETYDDFWNPEVMLKTYGFDNKNPDIAAFSDEFQYWLSCFVSSISLKHWAALLGQNTSECYHYFRKDNQFKPPIKGRITSYLSDSLESLALKTKDQDLLMTILEDDLDSPSSFLEVLTKENWEFYMLKNKSQLFTIALKSYSAVSDHEWSEEFSKNLIKEVFRYVTTSPYANLDTYFRATTAKHLHPNVLEFLYEINLKEAQALRDNTIWESKFYTPITKVLEIKKALNSLK